MESVIDNVHRVLDTPAEVAPSTTSDKGVLAAGQQLLGHIEAMEVKRLKDMAAKEASRPLAYQRAKTASAARMMTNYECDAFIEEEISLRQRRSKWHHMDKCFKWKKIQEFVEAEFPAKAHDTTLMKTLRRLLQNNTIDKIVVYDNIEQRITGITHAFFAAQT